MTIGTQLNWRFPRLEEIVAAEKGAVRIGPFGSALKKHEYTDSGIRVLGIDDVLPNRLSSDKCKYIPLRKYDGLRQYTVKPGDVLVTNMGTVGRTCVVPDDLEQAIISSHLIKVSVDESQILPTYLSWALNASSAVVAQVSADSRGAIMAGFNSGLLKNLRIPLPPLAEQRRISDILDRGDLILAKRRGAVAQLNSLTASVFAHMFGEPATITSQWPVENLGGLLSFLTSGSRGWAAYYADYGDLFLRIENVRHDELVLDGVAFVNAPVSAEATRTRVRPGDVLLSITADLGRTAVVPEDIGPAFINQHLAIMRTTAVVPRFLSAYLASPGGQRQVSARNRGGVKAGLNFADVRSLTIPVPPRPLQAEFARRVAAIAEFKGTLRSSLVQFDSLLAALKRRAFRGEL